MSDHLAIDLPLSREVGEKVAHYLEQLYVFPSLGSLSQAV